MSRVARLRSVTFWVAPVAVAVAGAVGCGAGSPAPASPRSSSHRVSSAPPPATSIYVPVPAPFVHRRPARLIAILSAAKRQGLMDWSPAVAVRGQPAVWISRVDAHGEAGQTVTLLRLDQQLVRLALHAGTEDPGGTGWRLGPAIGSRESRSLVAAFNSAFRPSYGAGGFIQDGRVGWRMLRGAASVVMYRDGTADIGPWHRGFPAPGRPVAEVRQNLHLLIDHGRIAPSVDTCIRLCWGDPLHEQPIVARSALGITAEGQLLWSAGSHLSVRALADALAGAGAVRAMELDINPAWVAGYLYTHPPRPAPVQPIPLVPGQIGVPGQFLAPYYRDFFSVQTQPAR